MKRLNERAKKAKDASLRKKVREEAKEILKSLTGEDMDNAAKQFPTLVADDTADIETTSSQGLSADISEATEFEQAVFGEPSTSGTQRKRPSQESMKTVSTEDSTLQHASERPERDSLGRQKSPPGTPSLEKPPAKTARKKSEANQKLLDRINKMIVDKEGPSEVIKC